jgi:hypothetical protein
MRVFLGADRIGLVRARRGLLRRTLEAVSVAGGRIDAMAGQLKGKNLPVRVYLSNHDVRLLALPWQDALENEEEWQAYAQHAFYSAFGGWGSGRVRLAMQGYGKPVIVAEVDEARHVVIQAAIEAAGGRLESMEPWCTAAFDCYRGKLKRDCWFFAAEPGMVVGMRIENGVLSAVSMHPLEAGWHDSVAAAIMRELAKHENGSALPVFVHAATPLSLNEGNLPGMAVNLLAAGRDDVLGMAA